MRRLDVPELEDFAWCPAGARDAATAFLARLAELARPYDGLAPRLAGAIRKSGARRVVDLASGAGGPWRTLGPLLAEHGAGVPVLLTDRFPPREEPDVTGVAGLDYHPEPVDATAVPAELDGFRTICGAFHHFPPDAARSLLEDAARSGQGIAVLEAVQRRPLPMALAALQPLLFLALAPTLRPFTPARLLWSYLLPLAPALLAVDGVASCLRAYTADELRDLTVGIAGHTWETGEVRGARVPVTATYLIGVPR
ncbi:MAG TPA: hypothetical protein VKA00_00150 [Trueperaceae bacterium]|nr:hypothetical protein [Trueperaceae bacterium]